VRIERWSGHPVRDEFIMRHSRTAFTLVETLCLAGVVLIVIVMVLGLFMSSRTRGARVQTEARQLRQIHSSLISYAASSEGGKFPRPGLINRLPIGDAGEEVDGRGPEDVSKNTTANLYSSLIALNYMTPQLLVSPRERNPRVSVCENYDYSKYCPTADVYWDAGFVADLQSGSNASFAHLPLVGQPRVRWMNNGDSKFVVLGNRMPVGGKPDPASFACEPDGSWMGHRVFNDGQVSWITVRSPDRVDSGLSFTKAVIEGKAVLQFD
jgi:type II secretory pathway pseudopilin PulG